MDNFFSLKRFRELRLSYRLLRRKASLAIRAKCGGRYRTRTDDLFRVKEARYQLRQSPISADLLVQKFCG